MSDDLNCIPPPNALARTSSNSKIRDLVVQVVRLKKHLRSKPKIRTFEHQIHNGSSRLSSTCSVRANATRHYVGVSAKIAGNSSIRDIHKVDMHLKIRVLGDGIVRNSYTDKIGGDLTEINSIPNFQSTQKLYPTADITNTLNGQTIVDRVNGTTNLFESINEGVFTGNYQENFNTSVRLSDDIETFIQPSAVYTDGTFRYKCQVTKPFSTPRDSFLFVRASAPIANFESAVPPAYRMYNILFEDPSGNLITQYKEMTIKGDSDYTKDDFNYSTYIFSPEINNAKKDTEHPDYPEFPDVEGYTLSFDIDVQCSCLLYTSPSPRDS